MITQFDMNPNGITEKRVERHRENAVVLMYRGLYGFLMGNAESGVFPFNSVLFGGCFPTVSPGVSPSANNEI